MAARIDEAAGDYEIDGIGPFDLGRIARLHRRCFDDAWSRSDLAQLMALPGGFGLIARTQGFNRLGIDTRRVVGFGLCRVVRDESELLSIGIGPEARQQGLGRRMLRACMTHCGGLGAVRMFLEVAIDNDAARALYDGEGFVAVGRREGYYRRGDGERVAAVTMRKDLQSS
ncbi:MAG: GNAT family N-acetyltransferase [Geminicoccaceae bacterium]|nr:MAG: GNAT family N-acetyltransferase [Geminicoccaceae bacterium]